MEKSTVEIKWHCDRCGAEVRGLPREFIEIGEFRRIDDPLNPVYPRDGLWQARVRFEYVTPAGFIAGITTTCPKCRVELLEAALAVVKKEIADGK